MSVTNDLVFSMLSFSKNYQPYVYDWGKRVGESIVKEDLDISSETKIKSENIFEHGIMAGAVEKLTTEKTIAPKMKYSQKHYESLREKNISKLSEDKLLELSYPYIYLSPGSHTLLYWIGKKTGLEIGSKHEHKINGLKKITEQLKLGNISISGNKIILHDSTFAKNARNTGKKICSYYAGFAAGFLSTSKRKAYVVERKCIAHGDSHCEFVMFF